MFREHGLPDAIRSDNGSPFASRAPGGLSRLSMWWLQLGIRHERIEPGHPEQNGRHERMHRTLKQETANPPKANRRRQQQAFGAFQREYNEQRPHEALGWKTPAELYVPSVRPYPARLPELQYPAGAHLRRISQQGSLKWKCERTFLSEVLARQTVGLLETEEEFFEVYYGPLLIGWFDGEIAPVCARTAAAAITSPQARRRKGRGNDALWKARKAKNRPSHAFHRAWKSLRDSHISTASMTTVYTQLRLRFGTETVTHVAGLKCYPCPRRRQLPPRAQQQ